MSWKIRLQQKQDREGNITDVKVKGVYRPVWSDNLDPSVDDPDKFPPVCRQMLLEYVDKVGNVTIHKVKHFAGAEKTQTERYFDHASQQVKERTKTYHTGGFIYEYQPATQLDYKGRKVVKEKQIQQKESRMPAAAFEQFLVQKHGEALTAEIMGAFNVD